MHILLGKFIIIFLNIISNSLFIYLRKNNLRMKGISNEDVISEVLGKVQVPTEAWNK